MDQIDPNSRGPLALHNEQFGPKGLLLRYAKGRTLTLLPRVCIGFLITMALVMWFDPLIPLLLFAFYLAADLVETGFLRNLPERLENGMTLQRARILSTVLAGVFACSVTLSASFPLFLPMEEDAQHLTLPIAYYAICIVLGPTLTAAFDLRYNLQASLLRISLMALCPPAVLIYQHYCCDETFTTPMVGLVIVATLAFGLALVWTCFYIQNRQMRSQRSMRSQALQRQALSDAYMRLYDQKQEARRLALIAENANDSVMLLDRDGQILWANEAFTQITGYKVEEALGKSPCDILHFGDERPDEVSEVEKGRREARAFRMTLQNSRKDGSVIWVDTNQVPVFDEKGELEAFIAVERDITATKTHEQELEAAKVAAEEGARIKEEFLATMSHEFRTPMNGVIGMAQLLQETELNPDQRLYIDTIQSSSQALLELINDVLDLSKMNASGVTLTEDDFEPHRVFSEALQLLRPQAEEKGLRLELELEAEVPQVVHGDHRRLRQIIVNLVGNAIKFTETGGVSVAVKATSIGDVVSFRFQVRDSGIGIAADKLEAIFDRFSQADAAITRKFGGTGLGLPISRHLAEAMGGTITVQSTLGKGSTFTVELQFQPAQARPEVVELPEGPAMPVVDGLKGLRVLVAEDNRVNRLIISKFLADYPIDLLFAEDGEEAVDIALAQRPHLVFMDVSMPKLNGIDATRAIRAEAYEQPLIAALTANVDDDSQQACRAAGMDRFLSKPLARRELVEILLQVADNARLQAGL